MEATMHYLQLLTPNNIKLVLGCALLVTITGVAIYKKLRGDDLDADEKRRVDDLLDNM